MFFRIICKTVCFQYLFSYINLCILQWGKIKIWLKLYFILVTASRGVNSSTMAHTFSDKQTYTNVNCPKTFIFSNIKLLLCIFHVTKCLPQATMLDNMSVWQKMKLIPSLNVLGCMSEWQEMKLPHWFNVLSCMSLWHKMKIPSPLNVLGCMSEWQEMKLIPPLKVLGWLSVSQEPSQLLWLLTSGLVNNPCKVYIFIDSLTK